MLQYNILTIPIESYTIGKDDAGNDVVLGGKLIKINPYKPVIDGVYQVESASPVLLNQFTPSFVNANGTFIKDGRYVLNTINGFYSAQNNLMEYQGRGGTAFNALIWDYTSLFPVAEVTNARQSDIAATSFEAEGSGNWIISSPVRDATAAVTGKQSYNLSNGDITRAFLAPGGVYIVSYWSQTGSKTIAGGVVSVSTKAGRKSGSWTYYEHVVTLSTVVNSGNGTVITISGNGLIDELRLYIPTAQMTTYTYDPLIGMTSKCDPNNGIVYYEYDALKRLALIRDQDGNIIKKIDYKYQANLNQ